jgi:hypothetical protein
MLDGLSQKEEERHGKKLVLDMLTSGKKEVSWTMTMQKQY